MSLPRKANDQRSAPHCTHCGFEMTPWRCRRGLNVEELDQVYECRSCGVMTMPAAPSADPPAPYRTR